MTFAVLLIRCFNSFAAGCTDGAGAFDFIQSTTEGNLFWDTIRDEILVRAVCSEEPPREYYDCHQPKPVLLPTGCKYI